MARMLGIDVGTSGARALVIDETGRVLAEASAEYGLSSPRPLWSEQKPEDWWTGVLGCLGALELDGIDGIGLTGQMHGSVFLDDRGEVIRPAILWNDQRTSAECDAMDAALGRERIMEITCNPPLTGFQAPKLLWLRSHEPESYARVRRMLLPKDYIRMRLTGVHATEPSDASGVGWFDVPRRTWSQEMLDALGIDGSILPDVVPSTGQTGETLGTHGLPTGIPVFGGAGDQAAAAVGTGAVVPGVLSISLGTSGVVFTALEEPKYDARGAAHTFCHANGAWHAMGVMLSCGGSLRWFRDTFHPGRPYDEIATIAAAAPPGCEGMTFLPYLSGERCPHNDPRARGAFAGLVLRHGPEHVARSVFEGVSFGLAQAFRTLEGLGATSKEVRLTGGGAKSRFWAEILADLLGSTCVRPEVDEGPAYGAAILAGVGLGVWSSVQSACQEVVRAGETVPPQGADYKEALERHRGLYEATRPWNP